MSMRQGALWRNALGALAAAVWALASHWASAGAGPVDARVAAAVLPLALALLLLAWQAPRRGWAVTAAVAAAALASWWAWPWLRAHLVWLFCLQHLGVHLALGAWFGLSLLPGREPCVTSMARLIRPPPLTERLQRYTRGVTWLWALFFLGNAVVSLALFAWAPVEVWSVHANLLTGPLVALVFLGEMLVRRLRLPVQERPTLGDVVRSWRLRSARGGVPTPPGALLP